MKFTEDTDFIVRFMAAHNMVYSRQNYLECLFAFDGVPDQIDIETELSLPADLQLSPPEEFE